MHTVPIADLPFQTYDPTQPTKNKNSPPITNPTQANPWVNPTHGQLWGDLVSLERLLYSLRFAEMHPIIRLTRLSSMVIRVRLFLLQRYYARLLIAQ